jgi:hypothetical protein
MRRTAAAATVLVLLALPACDGGTEPGTPTSPTPQPSPEPSGEPTPEPTPSASGPRLASGEPLPATCPTTPAAPGDTVAFVANGRAWALSPDGARLACLFEAPDPGPFAWGPRGDRALLANLEIQGLGSAPSRPAEPFEPLASSWGRPTGKSVVFVPTDGSRLEKVHLDRAALEDVTPIPDVRYINVVYHPSGLAFGFAVEQGGQEALWLSSNVGADSRRVVFTEVGTRFGAMVFTKDGKRLLYAAQHNDDHPDLHTIDLTDTSKAPVLWRGPVGVQILDIHAGPGPRAVAFSVGRSCGDAVAMARTASRPEGFELLPDEDRANRAVGWLDGGRVLVAAGGCDGPLDLFAVDAASGTTTPLVLEVDAASARTPEPSPPPPLPASVPDDGGFG